MKAVIIAGGLAKRLGDISKDTPKALVSVDGKPIIERQILKLKKHGFSEIVICTGHMSEKIRAFVGDGSRWGVKVSYSHEPEPLGTGGALKNAERLIGGPFLLIYGDLIIDMDLSKLLRFHKQKGGIGTLTVHQSSHPYDSDILELAGDSSIVRFLGKPKQGQAFSNIANAGVYCFERSILNHFPAGYSMLDKEVLPSVLKGGGRLFAYQTEERVSDLGTIERLHGFCGEKDGKRPAT